MSVIKTLTAHQVSRKLKKRVKDARSETETTAGFIVHMTTDDGFEGIGWAHESRTISGETTASIRSAIEDVIRPLVIGRHAQEIASIMETIESRLVFNFRAKAGVDIALHDIAAQAAGLPLHRFLGGARSRSVDCIRMISLDTPDEMAKEATEQKALGYRHFKLKIDATASDFDRVRAVATVLDDGGKLILDANQAYQPKDVIQLMDRLHDCPIAILEQPVPVHDLKGMALVRRSVRPMVEADESVRTVMDAISIIEHEAADIISLKIPKMGGIYFASKIADLCHSAGVPNLVGSNVGSCIIDLVATHFACTHPNVTGFAAEIGDSERLVEDLAVGLNVRDGRSFLPDIPGIGASLIRSLNAGVI